MLHGVVSQAGFNLDMSNAQTEEPDARAYEALEPIPELEETK